MRTTCILTHSALCSALAVHQTSDIDYNAAPPNLSTLANSSLFDTWRPRAHVQPPFGNIGDPCAHYTDPVTGLFHVGWLSRGVSAATTDDLVKYRDVNPDGGQIIRAGGLNDPIAVFDGSVIPEGVDGFPTFFYTSVSYLPIQWTINYTRGAETQSLAVSRDGGKNFTQLKQGPVIPDPPFALNVTGFRDPFVFKHAEFDKLHESESGTWYTVIAGGVHDEGPRFFLYRQHDPQFQYWEYLGEWFSEPANSTWGEGVWAGRWGFNFEVPNVVGLDEEGYNEEGEVFATLGAEWSLAPIVPQVSDFREQLWAAGSLEKDNSTGQVTFAPNMAGYVDWGFSAYAAQGKHLPASSQASSKIGAPDRFITYIWLTGNLFGTAENFPTAQQNWTGALLLPRELSLGKISNVVDNDLSREESASWRVESEKDNGLLGLATLKQVVAREILATITDNSTSTITEEPRTIDTTATIPFSTIPDSKFFVLQANITFPSSARNDSSLKAGFQILASEQEATTIYYQFSNESIIIDRSNTSAAALTTSGIDSFNEAGRLRLFDVSVDGQEVAVETLQLMVIVDNSVVEVHANERFALSTWARSWYEGSREVRFWQEGAGEVEVMYEGVVVRERLWDAWPERE